MKYRNYKFDETLFRNELIKEMGKIYLDDESLDYDTFHHAFMSILEKYAPIKEKRVRANNAPFMNKTLSKAFMYRSRLKNNFNKNPTHENKVLYNKQRNFCVSLVKKEKQNYYNNLDVTIFDSNRKIWKRIKPLFSDKQKAVPKDIILIEKDKVTSENKEVAEKLNNFFADAVANLEIESYDIESENNPLCNSIDNIIMKYEFHPSIIQFKEHVQVESEFSFTDVTSLDFQNEIRSHDTSKRLA